MPSSGQPIRRVTYVAPSLLPHYIAAHEYKPPDEALEAFNNPL